MIDGRLESHGRGLEEGRIKKVLCEHIKDSSKYHLQRSGWSSCSHMEKEQLHLKTTESSKGKNKLAIDTTNEIVIKSAIRSVKFIISGPSSLITSNGAWVDTLSRLKQWRTTPMRNSFQVRR